MVRPVHPTSSTSAFYERLQRENVQLATLIDLEIPNFAWHWTTSNHRILYTLSGNLTTYEPFPGRTISGIEDGSDLGVAVIDFVMANTGDVLRKVLSAQDLDMAALKVGEVFVDTPNLGRRWRYEGKLGEYTYDRQNISGQARNLWNSADVNFPHYNYQDNCVWRFGSSGCGFNVASVTLAVGSVVVGSCTTWSLLLNSGTISASFSNGRFDFGRVTITDGVNSGHIRTVRVHTGDLLELSHPLPINSFTNMKLSIYPGCRKRRIEDCHSLYNNVKNFLGFPWIPVQEDAFVAG
jgi:uncharacterized phage protein (TIGR02218 family)